jgi:alpha-L-fucosidase
VIRRYNSGTTLLFFVPGIGIRSLASLADVYHSTIGHNTNMLLDIAPMPNGSVPEYAKKRYAEFGGWIRACYGKAAVAEGSISPATPERTVVIKLPSAGKHGE